MELSLCMIVRNEEATLARCLESVTGAVDEIVIVDTGSADGTKEIALRYTDKVIDFPWRDDFSAARNEAFAHAAKPYLLWLDADDVLDAGDRAKLIALKPRLDGTVDAVMTPYYYAFDGSGRPSLIFERERIVRAAAGFRFEGAVHEAMAVSGRVIHEDIVIRHARAADAGHTGRNLAIYERMIANGERLAKRDRYYYARELADAGRHREAEAAFARFLDMDAGDDERQDACIRRGRCLLALGDYDGAKAQLFGALAVRAGRAEAFCALGEVCMAQGKDDDAMFYYRAALLCGEPPMGCAFTEPAAYDYIPLMQLCVLCDRRGDYCEASRMNERALLLRPDDANALRNRAYFEELFERSRLICGS